ncbi:NBS resistance-like protein [Hibiscus syriacus]|uniref:NBS resistance-like protein n=1 Tax=Hibiscus syriacus TaxID=106335 RepID=A0A6A2ZHC9_HIBSY|nr:uncharacterized protein LOC120145639 [Hibiscus syriacus]KAE8691000.1 NBS resistance-like protein [Hibiscus syriacus]
MGENIAHLHQNHADEEEEEEEAFSLRDFPLDSDAKNIPGLTRRSSSASAPEFFEFLSDLTYDMCPADDIIFCGKLIPLNQQQHIPFEEKKIKNNVLRKRSESFSELRSESINRSDSTKDYAYKCLRNSRSLDYKKLRRHDMERNLSKRSARKSDISAMKVNKRRWYVFMLGMVKFPPEMELKDIKSRQFRRNPSVMFPTVEDNGKKVSGDRSSVKGSSWSLLKALSCRDHSSVAVATSLWMPRA